MTEKLVYECENCGKSLEVSADKAKAPECCDKPMKRFEPLDACQVSTTACDDGRSGGDASHFIRGNAAGDD